MDINCRFVFGILILWNDEKFNVKIYHLRKNSEDLEELEEEMQ